MNQTINKNIKNFNNNISDYFNNDGKWLYERYFANNMRNDFENNYIDTNVSDYNNIRKEKIENKLMENKIKYFNYFLREKISNINYNIINAINKIKEDYENLLNTYLLQDIRQDIEEDEQQDKKNKNKENENKERKIKQILENDKVINNILLTIENNFYSRIYKGILYGLNLPLNIKELQFIYVDILKEWIKYFDKNIFIKNDGINNCCYSFFENQLNDDMLNICKNKITEASKILNTYKKNKEKFLQINNDNKKELIKIKNCKKKLNLLKLYCNYIINIVKEKMLQANLFWDNTKMYIKNNIISTIQQKILEFKINTKISTLTTPSLTTPSYHKSYQEFTNPIILQNLSFKSKKN